MTKLGGCCLQRRGEFGIGSVLTCGHKCCMAFPAVFSHVPNPQFLLPVMPPASVPLPVVVITLPLHPEEHLIMPRADKSIFCERQKDHVLCCLLLFETSKKLYSKKNFRTKMAELARSEQSQRDCG